MRFWCRTHYFVTKRWALWIPFAPSVVEPMWPTSRIKSSRPGPRFSETINCCPVGEWNGSINNLKQVSFPQFSPVFQKLGVTSENPSRSTGIVWGDPREGESTEQRKGEGRCGCEAPPCEAKPTTFKRMNFWDVFCDQKNVKGFLPCHFGSATCYSSNMKMWELSRIDLKLVRLGRNHIWVFIKCLIENPAFDSQTKDRCQGFPSSSPTHLKYPEKCPDSTANIDSFSLASAS